MADWNPSLYLQYKTERSRPAAELLSRVALESVRSVVDLGCGPGNSTALLHQRWPSAQITGVDTSPAMLNEARNTLPNNVLSHYGFASGNYRLGKLDGPAPLVAGFERKRATSLPGALP